MIAWTAALIGGRGPGRGRDTSAWPALLDAAGMVRRIGNDSDHHRLVGGVPLRGPPHGTGAVGVSGMGGLRHEALTAKIVIVPGGQLTSNTTGSGPTPSHGMVLHEVVLLPMKLTRRSLSPGTPVVWAGATAARARRAKDASRWFMVGALLCGPQE